MQRHDPRSTGVTLESSKRVRTLALSLSVLVAGTAFYASNVRAQSLPSTNTVAVPTYEAVGLYWQSPGGTTGCEVQYRVAGTSTWAKGLALWYDSRDAQCRGSLVGLTPNTSYEVQLNLPGQAPSRALTFKTWSNQVPVAKTITVPAGSSTFNVAEGGSAAGYVVYDGKGATLNANNAAQYNVTINASYVIVRGLNLKGAIQDAIRISPNVHDVIIEDNDISGWGRTRDGKWGADMDSAIRAVCQTETLVRTTIQRNRIHDPRYSANSWTDGHPAGPQGITYSYCGGNHVFRHNEIYSTTGNRFNDGMGGEDNFSKTGFPNADSDIYGNKITHTWDDAIEAEGANENVRIWGNYMDRNAIGIATTVTSVGPVYLFRNVFNRNQFFDKRTPDTDDRQPFFKSGSDASLGDGRRYIFHNTMLQATEAGSQYGLGGGAGVGGTGSTQPINNTVSMNNIYHLWKPNGAMYQVGRNNQFANDLYNGNPGEASYTNGMQGTPVYASGNGWQSEGGGMYQLATTSPGYGKGIRIANFNDDVAAPDVGAHQSGKPAMKFGVAASAGSAVGGAGSTTTQPPATNPPPTTTSALTADQASLTFTSATTQYVNFRNTGSSTISLGKPTMSSAKFAVKSSCGTSLAAGAACRIGVTYSANRSGATTGTLSLSSSAGSASVAVSYGSATTTTPPPTTTTPPPTTTNPPPSSSGGIVVSASTLTFGTTQATKTVTFTNKTTQSVTFIQAIMSSTKFGQKNTCTTVAPGKSCTAYVTYYPTYGGSNTGTFTMTNSASSTPAVVNLTAG